MAGCLWCLMPALFATVSTYLLNVNSPPPNLTKSRRANMHSHSVIILTVSLQLLWSSILKCFLDVCKSRIHNLYTKSVLKLSFAPVVIVVNTSSLSCIAFLDVLNKKRNLFRTQNWNFSKGQKSQFSKGVNPRLVSKKLKFFFFRLKTLENRVSWCST